MADISVTEEGIEVAGVLQLTWNEIDERRNRFRFKDYVLVKVEFTYGRVSDIYEHRVLKKDEWANIKEVMSGKTAWYGDFAGKHSETSIDFWTNVDVTEITDQEEIAKFHTAHAYWDSNLDIIYAGLYQLMENGEIAEVDGRYVIIDGNDAED